MKKYEFKYTIKEINLQTGNVLIEYVPINTLLTNYILNIPVFLYDENDKKYTLIESINLYAPHNMWETQEMLLEHGASILNTSGIIDPNATV